jgi:ferredoxin/flavodoxin---NADP+ reductase
MIYAITQACCTDAACVRACPVNCIHPTPDEPGFGATGMLYVDPASCIGCGACADVCPVDAVLPVDALPESQAVYASINRQYFGGGPADNSWAAPRFPRSLPAAVATPRVAVVGTGPAAGYTVRALLRSTDAEITVIDRAAVPGGLIRLGVAPDHPATKRIGGRFALAYRHPRVRVRLGVEVGRDVSHAEIARHHHAVIYAVGASAARALGIPGEDLPGCITARDFTAWSNGQPDAGPSPADLSARRAVVVGNGNVALDVARLLLTDPAELATTGIAPDALAALRGSDVSEVVLLGRRGPEHAAYTRQEFLGLTRVPGLRVVVDGDAALAGELAAAEPGSLAGLLRDVPVEAVDWNAQAGRRLVLRFDSAPVAVHGPGRVRAVRVTERGVGTRDIPAGLLIRSVGSRGVPIPGLPFDRETGIIPNVAGRVSEGVYVVGWAKRGASGGIGANRRCAEETIEALIDDAAAGRLPSPDGTARAFARLARRLASARTAADR